MANQKDILIKVIEAVSKKLIAAEKELTELDSMGDADCGSGVRRGFEAVQNAAGEFLQLGVGGILKKVGFTLAYTIGGTSGAMLGTGFIETGKSIGEKSSPSAADWAIAADSALEVIKRRGGNTRVGDKTLVDSLEPAVMAMKKMLEALQPGIEFDKDKNHGELLTEEHALNGSAGAQFSENDNEVIMHMMQAAFMAAKEGSDRTIDMIARKGRASYVGERSRGNRDPGSLIVSIIFEAALEVLRSNS